MASSGQIWGAVGIINALKSYINKLKSYVGGTLDLALILEIRTA